MSASAWASSALQNSSSAPEVQSRKFPGPTSLRKPTDAASTARAMPPGPRLRRQPPHRFAWRFREIGIARNQDQTRIVQQPDRHVRKGEREVGAAIGQKTPFAVRVDDGHEHSGRQQRVGDQDRIDLEALEVGFEMRLAPPLPEQRSSPACPSNPATPPGWLPIRPAASGSRRAGPSHAPAAPGASR